MFAIINQPSDVHVKILLNSNCMINTLNIAPCPLQPGHVLVNRAEEVTSLSSGYKDLNKCRHILCVTLHYISSRACCTMTFSISAHSSQYLHTQKATDTSHWQVTNSRQQSGTAPPEELASPYLEWAVNKCFIQVNHHTLFPIVRYYHLW